MQVLSEGHLPHDSELNVQATFCSSAARCRYDSFCCWSSALKPGRSSAIDDWGMRIHRAAASEQKLGNDVLQALMRQRSPCCMEFITSLLDDHTLRTQCTQWPASLPILMAQWVRHIRMKAGARTRSSRSWSFVNTWQWRFLALASTIRQGP